MWSVLLAIDSCAERVTVVLLGFSLSLCFSFLDLKHQAFRHLLFIHVLNVLHLQAACVLSCFFTEALHIWCFNTIVFFYSEQVDDSIVHTKTRKPNLQSQNNFVQFDLHKLNLDLLTLHISALNFKWLLRFVLRT